MIENYKICYIINFYFGFRRKGVEEFNRDRTYYVKRQIETLNEFRHRVDKIIFNFNLEVEHYNLFNEVLKIIPSKIGYSEVEINIRQNKGFSYAAFSEIYLSKRNKFDYFIFNEDDYVLVQNDWDKYLVEKFESLPNAGYLCPIVREPNEWNDNKRFAGHSFGISRNDILSKVIDNFGKLPHSLENDYKLQERVQIDFTNVYEQIGYKIYDIREDYRVPFAMTQPQDPEIHRHFWWNDKDLIVPILFLNNQTYSWWESYDGEYIRKNWI